MERPDLAAAVGRSRRLLALPLLVLAGACGSGHIVVVDPSVPPVLDDGELVVTLDDGERVPLRIRGEPGRETEKAECEAGFYEDIGSLTFVERTLATETFGSQAEEDARRAELRERILRRREELEEAFLARFHGEYSPPDSRVVDCNLVLQPDDLIYMRLRFAGSRSSNVAIGCLGEGEARAQIRNPASVDLLKGKDTDPPMLEFVPSNCGIEPLTEGGDDFVDEQGAVKSRCDPVRNVRITNCRIRGRTEARSFGGDLATLSMIRADHVERLRASAPQHVIFSSVKLDGRYKGVVHLQPGVHHFTIQDSELLGAFVAMTVHLPADGGWNVLRDNTITGQRKKARTIFNQIGKKREVISIDSSEHNRIVNNHIADMKYGGIELYRNCGEKGGIRHRVPQYNQIINNVFDYSQGNSNQPMVFLGSRDDKSIKWSFGHGVKGYCHEDEGPNGERFAGNDVPEIWDTEVVRNSSESNGDWAQHNLIADNQAIRFRPASVDLTGRIKLSSKAKNLENLLIGNELERDRTLEEALDLQRTRRAGCAVLAGVTDGMEPPFRDEVRNGNLPYIRDGWTIKYFWDIRPSVRLACGTPLVCHDNLLVATAAVTCEEPTVRDFGTEAEACDAPDTVCVEGSNAGDAEELGCGTNLLAVQAACNLEFGKATDAQRDRSLLNRITVVRPSDHRDDGRCTADGTGVREGHRLVMPWLLERYEGSGARRNLVRYSCKEHDRNGGDCHVNVRHYCEPPGPID
ncbi:MAG: hypothetical protein R2991_07315 [Thermoanaerobaculia bacterium]